MKNILLTTLGTITVGTLAFAQMNGKSHSSMMAGGSMPMMDHSMMEMSMMGNLDQLSGKSFDRAFLSMMVPHHQAAVEMSQAVIGTKDPKVKVWAEGIIKEQKAEITKMNTLLKPYGGADTKMAGHMKSMMSGMVNDIRKAKDKDKAFVQEMLPHHNSAITMACAALMRSQNPTILKLARDIVTSQAQEMYNFKMYLLK